MPTINKPKKKTSVKREKALTIYRNVYNTSLWRNIRSAYLMEHPLCEMCLQDGKTTVATDVHHKTEISNGNTVEEMQELGFDYSNLMALCEDCHTRLHAEKHRKQKTK